MIKFKKISKYENVELAMPQRATKDSAGYDMVAAEDTTILPYEWHCQNLVTNIGHKQLQTLSLDAIAKYTKSLQAKPTLISTGMKCYMENDMYLKLVPRSSLPLKSWLIMANSEGIIDAKYVDNEDNEGEIFFQYINLSPYPITIKRGEKIGQAIFCKFYKTDDDNATGERKGGFGSTDK